MTWDIYRVWVQNRLGDEYELLPGEDRGLGFRCLHHGDALYFTLEPAEGGDAPLRIKARFRGVPR